MKYGVVVGGIFLSAIVLACVVFYARLAQAPSAPVAVGGQPMLPTKTITVKNIPVVAEVATTDTQKSQGLSDRASLPEGTSMLFVFTEPSREGFWMKDMLFPLDILWANEHGVIVTIFENLSPKTYPNVYRPEVPANYVLEVPAGFVAAHGIAVGDKIVL